MSNFVCVRAFAPGTYRGHHALSKVTINLDTVTQYYPDFAEIPARDHGKVPLTGATVIEFTNGKTLVVNESYETFDTRMRNVKADPKE